MPKESHIKHFLDFLQSVTILLNLAKLPCGITLDKHPISRNNDIFLFSMLLVYLLAFYESFSWNDRLELPCFLYFERRTRLHCHLFVILSRLPEMSSLIFLFQILLFLLNLLSRCIEHPLTFLGGQTAKFDPAVITRLISVLSLVKFNLGLFSLQDEQRLLL